MAGRRALLAGARDNAERFIDRVPIDQPDEIVEEDIAHRSTANRMLPVLFGDDSLPNLYLSTEALNHQQSQTSTNTHAQVS